MPSLSAFSCRIPKSQHGEYKVLYNSKLLFRRRLYADLETILYHVRLASPMAQLMRQQAFYVRNAVPRTVFQALARWAWGKGRERSGGKGRVLPLLLLIQSCSLDV